MITMAMPDSSPREAPCGANPHEPAHAPAMRDDFYRILMEESQMPFFDYDVSADELCLSAVGVNGRRTLWRVSSLTRAMSRTAAIPNDLRQSMISTALHYRTCEGKGSFSICVDLLETGEYRWYLVFLHSLCDQSGRVSRIIGRMNDLEAEKKAEQRLKKLEERARRDSVTGLYNRATTEELIQSMLKRNDYEYCFFIFDVDNFKRVNDTQGHAEGDRLLRLVSDTLRAHMREEDVLGRIGGDEFAALIRCGGRVEVVNRRASEILTAVQKIEFSSARQSGKSLSISIGVARSPEQGRDFETLYRMADQALYRAKDAGKNRYCTIN
ncbi:MAG: GGDEF domain-containing protein [Clostridia bacterium]